jgi:glycosyltransferase involved in cell wall biosynthesis
MQHTPILETTNSKDLPDSGVRRLKRVLFIMQLDPAGKFGSLEEQVLTLARSFREGDSLFLPMYVRPLDPQSASEYAQVGLRIEALDLGRLGLGPLCLLLRLIRQHQIEVVHWNFYHPLFNPYLWALSMLRPRLEHYFTDHISRPATASRPNGSGGLKLRLKKVLALRYRKILCVSDFVLAQVQGMAGGRAERIHYFVNSERFRPEPNTRRHVRQSLGVGEEFVAVTVSQLIKEKGIDVAVYALAALPCDVLLWIIGRGPEEDKLKALVRDLGLEGRVCFLGTRRNVEPFLQAADCALCPSIYAEAAGLINLEALACGLPVIASRIGGIPEFVVDGSNGFLFAPGDHQELADRLRHLIRDEPLHRCLAQVARSTAVERFSTESQIENSLRLYQSAATGSLVS